MSPFSSQSLSAHLATLLPETEVVPVTALRNELFVSCVDGRRSESTAGAPGGNAGLLIRLLTVWEDGVGREISPEALGRTFNRYLDHFGAFYLHSDRLAQDLLAQHMGVAPEEMDAVLRSPPDELRAPLLEALIHPPHMGCGHLRLLLEHPREYGTRRGLTEGVIQMFFSRLWEGDQRLHLDVLNGVHAEEAVVQIQEPQGGRLVTLRPRHAGVEFFVHHPDAEAYLEELHARFLAGTEKMTPAEIPATVEAQRELGTRQLKQTLSRLAAGLPLFRVRLDVDGDGVPTVTEVRALGTVPPLPPSPDC